MEGKKKNCYYTYGGGCPGIMAPAGRHVLKRCTQCRDFNGNLGEYKAHPLKKRKAAAG